MRFRVVIEDAIIVGDDAFEGIDSSEAEGVGGGVKVGGNLVMGVMDKVGKKVGGDDGEDREGGSGNV